MRCLGITIMFTVAATTHAGAHKCEQLRNTQAKTSPAQDGKP